MADTYLLAGYRSIPIRRVRSLALLDLLFISENAHQACFEE